MFTLILLWGAGVVVCLQQGADLYMPYMAQLMPLPLTVSCFTKIQTGFTFLVPAHPGSPGKRAFKRVCLCILLLRSVLCHCWLGGRKGIRPVKKLELWGTGVVIWLERGADLHMAQWLPHPLTVSWFSKIQIGFTYLVLAHPGSPRQRAVKWVCVLYYCSTCHRHNVYFLGTSTVDYDLQ